MKTIQTLAAISVALMFAGCDIDRTYLARYDATSQTGAVGVSIRKAKVPGKGEAQIDITITGDLSEGKQVISIER